MKSRFEFFMPFMFFMVENSPNSKITGLGIAGDRAPKRLIVSYRTYEYQEIPDDSGRQSPDFSSLITVKINRQILAESLPDLNPQIGFILEQSKRHLKDLFHFIWIGAQVHGGIYPTDKGRDNQSIDG